VRARGEINRGTSFGFVPAAFMQIHGERQREPISAYKRNNTPKVRELEKSAAAWRGETLKIQVRADFFSPVGRFCAPRTSFVRVVCMRRTRRQSKQAFLISDHHLTGTLIPIACGFGNLDELFCKINCLHVLKIQKKNSFIFDQMFKERSMIIAHRQ
jgi:hypothetical protein